MLLMDTAEGVLAQTVDVTPDASGMPGGALIQQLLNWSQMLALVGVARSDPHRRRHVRPRPAGQLLRRRVPRQDAGDGRRRRRDPRRPGAGRGQPPLLGCERVTWPPARATRAAVVPPPGRCRRRRARLPRRHGGPWRARRSRAPAARKPPRRQRRPATRRAPGPTRDVDGAPAGFARTRDGARGGGDRLHRHAVAAAALPRARCGRSGGPGRRRRRVGRHLIADALAGLAGRPRAARRGHGRDLVGRSSRSPSKVEAYSHDRARVSVWLVRVLSRQGVVVPAVVVGHRDRRAGLGGRRLAAVVRRRRRRARPRCSTAPTSRRARPSSTPSSPASSCSTRRWRRR